ncbi:glycogenin 1 isoform X2 [Brevipalpus obovatus]|uniref:glycogenin 1 isoform X2 n=1 Tax=Brevipalpus obovatus TaxID=246614 RepID=UPI003D9FAC58
MSVSNEAFVTLATNDNYCLGALVLANSLRNVETKRQLVILITPSVTKDMRGCLSKVYDLVKEVDVMHSNEHKILEVMKRPELGVTLTKLHCWRLTQYTKCVFMDADTLPLKNIDELFEREELSAACDIGWPDCFNTGVFVYKPNETTFADLCRLAVESGSFDGGDQGLLNTYFTNWGTDITKHLSFIYNMSSVAVYSYPAAYAKFGDSVKVVHFLGSLKPWMYGYNTSTKTVVSPSHASHSQQLEHVQKWWDVFIHQVKPELTPDCAVNLACLHDIEEHDVQSSPPSSDDIDNTNGSKSSYLYLSNDSCIGNTTTTTTTTSIAEDDPEGSDGTRSEFEFSDNQDTSIKSTFSNISHDLHDNSDNEHDDDGSKIDNIISTRVLSSPSCSPHQVPQSNYVQSKEAWESYEMDYKGIDSFENIKRKLENTFNVYTPNTHDNNNNNNNDFPVIHAPKWKHTMEQANPATVSTTANTANTFSSTARFGPVTYISPATATSATSACPKLFDQKNHPSGGLAANLARLRLDSPEGDFYYGAVFGGVPGDDYSRRRAWEQGSVDYLGADSFENIQKKLDQAIGVVSQDTSSQSESNGGSAPQ